MATKVLSTFTPVLLLLFVNLAASRELQSGLLSNLLKSNSYSNNPIVVALDNNALAKLGSENLDSDFVDVEKRNRNPLVYLYQLGQSKNIDERIFNPGQSRGRKQRYGNRQYRNNRYRPRYEHRHNKDRRDRYRNDYGDRYQPRKDRHRQDRYVRDDDRYSRPLRSDNNNQEQEGKERIQELEERDRKDREQDDRERRDRDGQDTDKGDKVTQDQEREDRQKFRSQDSARAQIPVIKSLLRSLSCNARDECQDTCGGPEKNECEDECEEKYECKDEEEIEEEENDSCDTCNEKPSSKPPKCTGSTKGERIVTKAPKCKRC